VPVPSARTLDELNAMLLAGCREDEMRTIDGCEHTVGGALAIERDHLLPMPTEGFDLVEVSFARVDGLRRVRVRSNAYSAPVWPGTAVQVKLAAATVEIWHQGGAWYGMPARTVVTRRSSTWSTTWTCSSASPVRWRAASRWSSGAELDAGRPATTDSGRR
jgi:hypothetical protein